MMCDRDASTAPFYYTDNNSVQHRHLCTKHLRMMRDRVKPNWKTKKAAIAGQIAERLYHDPM